MRKTLLASLILLLFALVVSCGNDKKVLPLTQRFAFLRAAPTGSEGPMQPMLGAFQGSKFVVQTITDSSTGKPVTADFQSIILSSDGKKATFDMWPSSSTYGRAAGQASAYWPDIFVANTDGSALVQITHGETYVSHPSFSPDGKKVVFLANNSSSPWDTMTANVDGTGTTDLTADSPVCHHEAMFSPDGTKIVFAGHTSAGIMDIYVMNADGTNPVNLTNQPDYNADNLLPTFSADGSKIAFTKVVYGNTDTANVYVMNSDGSNPTALTTTSLDGYPRYLGESVTFNSFRDANMEIYMMAADGSGQTRLTNNTVYDSFSADVYDIVGGGGTRNARQLHTPRH